MVLVDDKEMKLRCLTRENEDLKQQLKVYQEVCGIMYICIYVQYEQSCMCIRMCECALCTYLYNDVFIIRMYIHTYVCTI